MKADVIESEKIRKGYEDVLGATEIATLDLKLRLCNAMDFLPGATFDAWLFADGMYFLDDPGISALPDTLLAAGFDRLFGEEGVGGLPPAPNDEE